jgi:nicotinamide-nucleotide amidase
MLRRKGAVCIEIACAMAEGALRQSPADFAVAITGVAGPEPDEDGNPVGRVCIAVAARGEAARGFGRGYEDRGREAIRHRAVADALAALVERISACSDNERSPTP